MGVTPIATAAQHSHEVVVRLLAHLGARLLDGDGDEFWTFCQGDGTRQRMHNFWRGVIDAGGNEGTEESRRIRRRAMIKAGLHDPRDGSADAERVE